MYATVAAMTARFGQRELIALTDNEEPYTGEVNNEKLQAAIDMANSEVDGYLTARYGATIIQPSPFLIGTACDIARYHAAVGGSRVTERDEVRYASAVKTLKAISEGKISVGKPSEGAVPAPTVSNEVIFQNGRRNDFGKGGW